jgi:hypothetical protein
MLNVSGLNLTVGLCETSMRQFNLSSFLDMAALPDSAVLPNVANTQFDLLPNLASLR